MNKIKTKFGFAHIDNGYYRIFSNEKGNRGKLLHRLIFEDFYQIKLPSKIIIHHLDENKLNNNIWNLIPLTRSEHIYVHSKGKKWSIEHLDKFNKSKNTTGYYHVSKTKSDTCNQGFRWRYYYIDEKGKHCAITSTKIEELKKKVLHKGLKWEEFNGGS